LKKKEESYKIPDDEEYTSSVKNSIIIEKETTNDLKLKNKLSEETFKNQKIEESKNSLEQSTLSVKK
jgi:hypothetical protein